jgi:hypothetical protein
MTVTPEKESLDSKSASSEGYDVTRWGAFCFCAGAFGAGAVDASIQRGEQQSCHLLTASWFAAVAAMSFISYRRGLRQCASCGLCGVAAHLLAKVLCSSLESLHMLCDM